MWDQLMEEMETSVDSFSGVKELLQTHFKATTFGVNLGKVDVDEEGYLSVDNDFSYPMTKSALKSLCRILRIPLAYARRIKEDLLVHNINSLKSGLDDRVVIFIINDRIVNIVRHPFICLSNKEIAEHIEMQLNELNCSVNEVRISDAGIDIMLLFTDKRIEPIVGDTSLVGMRIQNSETGFLKGTKANFWVLRQVCSNGATLMAEWGNSEIKFDYELTVEEMMNEFVKQLKQMAIDFGSFTAKYTGLIRIRLSIMQFIRVWRRVAMVSGIRNADEILNTSKDHRASLMKRIDAGQANALTDWNAYDIFNQITEAAKDFEYEKRNQLEGIGGWIIDFVQPDQNQMKNAVNL